MDAQDASAILAELTGLIRAALGETVVGVYVYGSLVWGDFDPALSDLDLMTALTADVSAPHLQVLSALHDSFAGRHPRWRDRIEVQYVSTSALRDFRTSRHTMVNISPGEPLHRIDAGDEWLMNWYLVQIYGRTLYGPPPASFLPPLTPQDFIRAAADHATAWATYIRATEQSRPYQSYAILTLCRALYTVTTGEHVSKRQAAAWGAREMPEYADLIGRALIWREQANDATADPSQTYDEVRKAALAFIAEVQKRARRPGQAGTARSP